MKTSRELSEIFKSHLNTKIIIVCFVLEFVILTVLLSVTGHFGIEKHGSNALVDILKGAGNGSVLQYSDIGSVANGDNTFEFILGKYTTDDIALISSASPSFASFLNHEFNVKNYINGTKTDNKLEDDKPSSGVPADNSKYKFYQFVLNPDGYHSEVVFDDSSSVPVGVQIDNYNGNMIVKSYGEDFKYGRLTITNPYHVPDFDLKNILKTPLTIPLNEDDSPSVLIYYTHTSEGYCTTQSDKYDTKNILTSDTTKNVVACGNKIESILKNKHGVNVLNDTTKNDTDYNTAYDASEALLQDRLEKNKSIDIAIDIHRDSFVENGQKLAPTVSHDGKTYAPLLFVMGSDCLKENDNWESNIKLAMLLIEKMEEKVPGITKGISLRKDTYLSEYANKGLLIEIGFSGNYTEEATNTAEVFAEALGEVYGKDER